METGFEIGVGGLVVNENGEVLMVRHTYGELKGYWLLPGGHPELNEPLDEAVLREVLEETGIIARVQGIVAIRQRILTPEHQEIYIVFLLEHLTGQPQSDGRENDAVKYFSLQEVLANPKATPLAKSIIHRALVEKSPRLQLAESSPLVNFTYRLFY
ncbi:MAG: NUDIX domain-containing protein [Firmicutes bacterium]|nr:NUDIX domain-containing protein [Bacillota bacterium]